MEKKELQQVIGGLVDSAGVVEILEVLSEVCADRSRLTGALSNVGKANGWTRGMLLIDICVSRFARIGLKI